MKRRSSLLNINIFILGIIIIASGLAAQKSQPDENQIIQQIRKQYASINKAKNLKVKTKKYSCKSCPREGTLKASYEQEKLTLLTDEYSEGDHCGGKREFYFWQGKLFFAYKEQTCWEFDDDITRPAEKAPPIKEEIIEERYYFHEEKLIRFLLKSYEGPEISDTSKIESKKMDVNNAIGNEIKSEAGKLYKFFKSKKSYGDFYK